MINNTILKSFKKRYITLTGIYLFNIIDKVLYNGTQELIFELNPEQRFIKLQSGKC